MPGKPVALLRHALWAIEIEITGERVSVGIGLVVLALDICVQNKAYLKKHSSNFTIP